MSELVQTQGYFIECGAGLTPERNRTKYPFTRNHFMEPYEVASFVKRYQNIDVYQTSMIYIDPFWRLNRRGKWIIDADRTLKWSNFYLDFDDESGLTEEEDHIKMKEDMERSIRYLTIIFRIPEEYIQIYFSGHKGYHLIVDAHTVGLEPHYKLNQIFKEIAEDIKKYLTHDYLDVGIYDDKRLFRIPNSVNDKSGLYKIPLTVEEFRKMTIDEIRERAKKTKYVEFPTGSVSSRAPAVFKNVIEKWNKSAESQREFSHKILNIEGVPPCIKEMHEREFKETVDERNNSGTALASYYFQRGLPFEETLEIVTQWGHENCTPSLDGDATQVIVDSVYNGGYRYGCGTFERVSGVCDKDNCPLFKNKKCSIDESQIEEEAGALLPYDVNTN